MTNTKILTKMLLGATALTVFSVGSAHAAGTSAGTSVSNTFSLDYQVGGTDQPTIETCQTGDAGCTVDTSTKFTVDRKIDLTVVTQNSPLTVFPGSQDQGLVYTVTNTGNDNEAYKLTVAHETGDQFDATLTGNNVYVFPATAGGTCTLAGALIPANLYTAGRVTADVAPDAAICVVVEADISTSQVDGDESDVSLYEDTWTPTAYINETAPGTSIEEVADADSTNTIVGVAENVLVDVAGALGAPTDAANAGDHSAIGTYVVASADLSAVKSVVVIASDGSTGCTLGAAPAGPAANNPSAYAIPGACVEYVIEVKNEGSVDATSIDISDTLPTDVTFKSAHAVGFSGGTVSGTTTVALTGATLVKPTLPATETYGYLIIRATVN